MAENINKANFFVVGAAKAGTTSVYSYLEQHKEVFLSPIKEPCYFSKDIRPENFSHTYKKNTFLNNDDYFSKSTLTPLHLAHVQQEQHYQALFNQHFDVSKQQKISGECSTAYLYSEVAAQNIYEYNPEAKILIILRDPIKRSFSHYLMALRFGYTTKGLTEALEEDLAQPVKGWGISELFLELSLYYHQVKRYLDVFPSDQVKIMFFEQLKDDALSFMNEVCDFLQIKHFEHLEAEAKNEAQLPKNIKLNKFLTDSGIKKVLKAMLPGKLKEKAKAAYVQKDNIPTLSETEKNFLKKHLDADTQQLKQLLNTDFPW